MTNDKGVMAEKTIEDMKKELEAAGYSFHHFAVFTPDDWEHHPEQSSHWLDNETLETELLTKRVEKAYAHLLQQRRYASMEAMLTYFANAELPFPRSMSDGYQAFYKWQARVKALLLGKDGGE